MKLLHNIRKPIEISENEIFSEVRKEYGLSDAEEISVYKESVDCRHGKISKVYTLAIETDREHPDFTDIPEYKFEAEIKNKNLKVVIVGMGPSGLFCAKTLSDFGVTPTIIDRGSPVEERVKDVENLWSKGILNPESNVQFGEGGAGTFSDGKLTCRKNDPRSRKILSDFVSYGAPANIEKEALPHIGTDFLRKTVINMRNDLIKKGVKFIYNACFTDIETDSNGKVTAIKTSKGVVPCDVLVLALGNGSFDTFSMLMNKNVAFETKPMSFGVRQEHFQTDINRAIYGKAAENPLLPQASYSFYTHLDKETCVYSFCMCPGGKVVNSSSIPGRLTTNGMSDFSRDGQNSNAALLVSFTPQTVASALEFQKSIEKKAFSAAGGASPVSAKLSEKSSDTTIVPSILPTYEFADFTKIFPPHFISSLEKGSDIFHKKIFGSTPFERPIFTAPETRTSSPLRLKRDKETLKSLSHENIYPCGEGAGYAGGIMSSAIDGIKIAEKILTSY